MIATRQCSSPRARRAPAADFYQDVMRGLTARPKELPCKYFYDAVGSRLYEEICRLPEYYPTRTELAILQDNVEEIAAALGPSCLLIEFGSGASLKTRILLDHLEATAAYIPIDMAIEQLDASAVALAQAYPHLDVRPMPADFTQPLRLAAYDLWFRRKIVFFPGSTIGNFCGRAAVRLLRRIAHLCGEGGGVLLGADLKKDPQTIEAAYNDSRGVTAAFNLNLLERINCELGADFQASQFWHHAFYDAVHGRVEMQLVSKQDQHVTVAQRQFEFAQGEPIRTEHSHKYTLHDLQELTAAAGMRIEQSWIDPERLFSVSYLTIHGLPQNGHAARF